MSYQVEERIRESGIEYVSKSRIKSFITCPRKFFYTYFCGERPGDKYAFTKGREIHRTYEDFHTNLKSYVELHGERPDTFAGLLEDWSDHHQWLDPHIGNFWMFEEARYEAAYETVLDTHGARQTQELVLERWLPKAVEFEVWLGGAPSDEYVEERGQPDLVLDETPPPVGDVPWMGKADALLHACTIDGIDSDEGWVIVDYKSGKTPKEQYRDEGIFLESEYYGWLMEEVVDVAGVAGYYPQNDDLVTAPFPDFGRRNKIMDAVEAMMQLPDEENFPIDEQPLCHWGSGKCQHYEECPSSWGTKGGAGYHNKADKET
jgi:hypothetical protein